MQEPFLCLSDLLDQDLSSYEYFHSLPLEIQKKIEESDVNSFADMQQMAEKIKSDSRTGISKGRPFPSPMPNQPPVPIANKD